MGLSSKQKKGLKKGIIGIEKTENIEELIDIYSSADIFVNPTLEDNYPTTNIEAIACGTPVLSYNTGGSRESAEMYGLSVQKNNLEELSSALKNINCIKPKKINIDYHDTVRKYLQLYQQ